MPVLRFLFSKDQNTAQLKSQAHGVGEWFAGVYEGFLLWFSELAKGEPYKALAYLSIALVIITLFKNISRFTAMNFMVLIRNRSVRKMRLEIYEKCLKLPIAYFNNERKGDLMARMNSDVGEIEVAVVSLLELIFREPLAIIINVASLIYLSPDLTIISFFLLPISAFVISRIGKSLKRTAKKGQEQLGFLFSAMEEGLGGIRIIKAFTTDIYRFLLSYEYFIYEKKLV